MHAVPTDQTRLVMLIGLCGLLWALESIIPLYHFRNSRVTYTSATDFGKLSYGLDGFDIKERQILGGLLKMPFIGRYTLSGCSEPHGLLIDSEHRLAFVACEENAKLTVFDLDSKSVTATHTVGSHPDVLSFDKGFTRLYVSSESGVISMFDEQGRNLEKIGEGFLAPNAHSVAVDSRTHRVYFPLQNVSGKPVLRIAVPSDKQL